MPPPLSYPALKSVLEYVVLEKRIHLTSRSKFLQRVDKAIPVRANYFGTRGNNLRLDKFLFLTKHDYRRAEDKKNGKLLMSYLRGRSSVHVNSASFARVKTSQQIPVKLDLTINKLTTYYCDLEVLLSVINPRSFPLTDLSIILAEPTYVDHEIVHSAKNVSFEVSSLENNLIGVEKLQNKSARLEFCDLPITDFVRIINYWMQHGKEVGTEFLFVYSANSDLSEVMANLQEEFHRARGYLEEVNEHFLSGFSILLSSTSKLQVYGIRTHCDELIFKVV